MLNEKPSKLLVLQKKKPSELDARLSERPSVERKRRNNNVQERKLNDISAVSVRNNDSRRRRNMKLSTMLKLSVVEKLNKGNYSYVSEAFMIS